MSRIINQHRRKPWRASGCFILILGAVSQVDAAVENFSGYSAGSLFGQNGGSASGSIAWTGSWSDGGSGQSAAVFTGFSIGSVNGLSSSAPVVEYTLNTPSGRLESIRGFDHQSNRGGVESLYVYGLVSAGKSGGFNTADSFGGIGLYEGSTEKFLFGQRYQQSSWGATASGNLNGTGNNSSTSIGNFNVASLMLKVDQQANNSSFFVNPVLGETETQNINAGRRAFTFNHGSNDDDVDTLRLRGGNPNTGNAWQFDNLNVQRATPFPIAPLRSSVPANLGSNAVTLNLATNFPAYADITNAQSGYVTVNNSDGVSAPFVFVSMTGTTAERSAAVTLLQQRASTDGYTVLTGGAIPSTYNSYLRSGTIWDVVLAYASHPSPSSPYYFLWDLGNASGVTVDQILVVPEPSTLAVLWGSMLLGCARRRRQSRA